MKNWLVYYTTTEDDSCKVWTEAETKEEAEAIVREENWDFKEVVQVLPLNR